MNKYQKQVLQSQIRNEKTVLQDLKVKYKSALDDINKEIASLKARNDAGEQYVIYQLQYRQALKKQISGILDTLQGQQFTTISDYLRASYEDGFAGTMFDLYCQGIPLIFPIDQRQVVKAIETDSKLSKPFYDALGENITDLKFRVTDAITRGIASNASYADMAKEITRYMVGDYTKMSGGALYDAMRIARTEAHRINQSACFDAQKKAKAAGADIVKQWDATLDSRTRADHAALDGQIREIDEYFEIGSLKALYPGGFGVAGQDIHCRCVSLQRAKWALDDEELNELKQRAEYFGLDKSDDFERYKKKYLDINKDGEHNNIEGKLSDHARERMKERGVSASSIEDALENPLHKGKVEIDNIGRPSVTYIGSKATVCENPETGKIITAWQTGTDVRNKYYKDL